MRSDPRSLLLIPHRGAVNKKRRYRSLRNAVRRSIDQVMVDGYPQVIYDTARGVDVATVRRTNANVVVVIHTPRSFTKLWNQ